MFSTARVDRAVMPATNNRRTYLSCGVFPVSGWVASVVLQAAMASTRGSDVEPDEDTVGVREVSNDLAYVLRQTANERRHREDLVPRGERGVLDQVGVLGPGSCRRT